MYSMGTKEEIIAFCCLKGSSLICITIFVLTKVWFYDMKADGFSLDDKRQEIADNDIPDFIERFNHLDAESDRERTEQSFFVPVEEIVANDYDLSINKYKEVVYEAVQYESTDVIMGKIEAIEAEIQTELAELKKLLG